MCPHNMSIKNSLNKAYLKLPATRSQIDKFKSNFITLFNRIKGSEGEEFHKNEISDFLKNTYYSPNHYINTHGRFDLVIHNGKESSSRIGVLVECKSPGNQTEMPTITNLNVKAIHELILYFLEERITNNNLELKHLVATNLYEWFIFDAHVFEACFSNNKALIKQFHDFKEGRLSGKDTSFFYNAIAAPFLDNLDKQLEFTHFDLKDYRHLITNLNTEDDNLLIPLYKILSPEHLLKLQFKNDSNTLDKDFYLELLHIIGLEEIKKGSKKIIGRAKINNRNYSSLLESTISILRAEDLLSQVQNPAYYGESSDDQLFNISLELVITWINRILFLKLLEGQLVRYNQGDITYKFLNQSVIPDYDALNKLFFYILAVPLENREDRLKARFRNIPYLNSSLFEATDLERQTLRISNLDDSYKLSIFKGTVLKDYKGRKINGERLTLLYLFEFLDAYNFSSEGAKDIQEENKTLISASVLGLIFEKINGYKDGSFFTPGYITQYMCQETIKRAAIQKFNDVKGWNCQSITEIYNKIEEKPEANQIINSLRICDPAAGSGHFLVSALNEILAIKSELNILMDRKGKVLRDYKFEVVNDELIVTDPDGELFVYNPKNHESQRVQEAIFDQKQTIIEGCLFGVDINPNSVKICRLRLWIELLKHAYYKSDKVPPELETLPNIDINIKCGNSLLNRHSLDSDLKTALKSKKWTIDNYREAVLVYQNTSNKAEKRAMEDLIAKIKKDFVIEISRNNADVKQLNKFKNDLLKLTTEQLFDDDTNQKRTWRKKITYLNSRIASLELKIESLKNNEVFKNAFEWRIEFPQVLNNDSKYLGFDVVIGNPPYGVNTSKIERKILINNLGKVPDYEIYYWFINRAHSILKESGHFSFIIPNTLLFNLDASKYRLSLLNSWGFDEVLDCTNFSVFADATVRNVILTLQKNVLRDILYYRPTTNTQSFFNLINKPRVSLHKDKVIKNNHNWALLFRLDNTILDLIWKLKSLSHLSNYFDISQGYIPYRTSDLIKSLGEIEGKRITRERAWHSTVKINEEYKQEIFGRDITKYNYRASNSYVWYGKHLACYVDPKYFTSRRILVREITNPEIIACIVEDEFVNDPQLISIINKSGIEFDITLLWAILNSKLATFFHFNSSPKATKGAFPKILINDLNNFPIPDRISIQDQNEIIKLSKQIMAFKNANSESDINLMQSDLENHIYTIYGLSNSEINIIEQSLV